MPRPRLLATLFLALSLAATSCVPAPASISSASPSPSASAATTTASDSSAPSATATPAPTVEGMRIAIPRLGIDLQIHEGDLARDIPSDGFPGLTPEGAAFHLPGTDVPGYGGNSFVYAHARAGMFLALWQARPGDRVEIRRPDGTVLVYIVSQIHPSVSEDDTSWTDWTPDERLTLQTSTGPNSSYPRFIVVAERTA